MPVDASVVESPGWWLNRLGRKLENDRLRRRRMWDYYSGDHPIPEVPGVSDADAREWMSTGRANWIGLVIEAVRERLQVVGFRFGQDEGAEGGHLPTLRGLHPVGRGLYDEALLWRWA